MKEPPKIAVIVNPAAHKGGAGGVMPTLYSGAHVYHSKVRTSRGTSFRFVS
jgi:hypothetical protein